MVMDFAEIDEKVKPLIDAMDHKFIAEGDEATYDSLVYLRDPSVQLLGVRTTAENIAGQILGRLTEFWPRKTYWVAVRVWETDKAWAEVTSDDI
jgi:6-pyruvoyl-tetrahydropterin synthase